MKKIIPLIIFIISLAISILFYFKLPNLVASHWGINGQVDGYSSKLFITLLFPSLQLILSVLFFIIPKIDPKKANIEKFKGTFNIFIYAILTFFLVIQAQVLFWNIGYKFNMNVLMPILFGFLLFIIGFLTLEAKQNYTIGIKTPWTLASTKVWDKTHWLGGRMFIASGVLTALSALIPNYSYIVLLITIIFTTVFLFVYSYWEYKREK